MRKLIVTVALALMPMISLASSGAHNPFVEAANVDVSDNAAIQRGAKYFTNYCMGCHSAQYVRYQLMENVGLSEDDIKENLIFDGSKPGDLMKIAMPETDASAWFGAPAPDLTLETRIRNADWVNSYLKGFYSDDSRPMGVNNTVFPNVGMPNVLWELEGIKEAVYRYDVSHAGHVVTHFNTEAEAATYLKEHPEGHRVDKVVDHLVTVKEGSMTAAEFDQVSRDLSTYLSYIAEPEKLGRQRMGIWVILFLSLFSFLAYLMKKEWWKEIH